MTTIKIRRGTAAQWASAATVLAAGEPGVETDTGVYKVGDGSTAWASLNPVLNSIYAIVVGLPAATGTDDTTALNALLAANPGARFRGKPGAAYKISAPLIVYSGSELDMRGCSVTLIASSNCNMLQNRAVATANRTISDAAVNSSSTSLTSATAAFTSADTGRTIVVTGAATGASNKLCAIMTYVNATTVTLSVTAGATVSGAAASIYDRDTDITIQGGTWDRGSNGGSGSGVHTLFFRRVDRLRLRDMRCVSAAGKYFIYPADAHDLRVENIDLATFSDGVHVQGPASNVFITGITGTSADDTISIGNTDYGAGQNDTIGDVTDVTVDRVSSLTSNATAVVKLYGAAGNGGVLGATGGAGTTVMRNVLIKNVTGSGLTGPVVSTDIDGDMDGVSIDGLSVSSSFGVMVDVLTNAMGTLKVRNAGSPNETGGNATVVRLASGSTTGYLLVDGCSMKTTAAGTPRLVVVNATATVGRVHISNCQLYQPSGTAGSLLDVLGTVGRISIAGCDAELGASSGILRAESTAAITSATITGCSQKGASSGSMVIAQSSGTQLPRVFLTNNVATGLAFTADIGGTTDVYLANHSSDAGNLLNLRAAAVASLQGDGGIYNGGGTVSTTAGYALRVNHRNFRLDISKITAPVAGDQAQNTASASGVLPGAGPVVYDGSAWKRVDLGGVVKQGTATLSGGTVTVSDTAVTTTSKIRVYPKTLGGTPGALYISALTASTSFVITSTSNTDTSLVQYDIVQY